MAPCHLAIIFHFTTNTRQLSATLPLGYHTSLLGLTHCSVLPCRLAAPPDHTSLQTKPLIAQCDPAPWLPHYVQILLLPLSSHNSTVTLSPLKSLHSHLVILPFFILSSCSCHTGVTTSIHSTFIQSPSSSGKMASISWCKCLRKLPIRKKWHAMHDVSVCETLWRLYCESVKNCLWKCMWNHYCVWYIMHCDTVAC